MRDPKRIDEIVELLREVWKQSPDQRLGQLLDNVGGGLLPQVYGQTYRSSVRLIEDDKWLSALKSATKK